MYDIRASEIDGKWYIERTPYLWNGERWVLNVIDARSYSSQIIAENVALRLRRLILEELKDAENMFCPVCGYYCLGKGGHGCIDKPSYLEILQ